MAKRRVTPKVRVRKSREAVAIDFSSYEISDRFEEHDQRIRTIPQLIRACKEGKASLVAHVHGYSKRECRVVQKKISQKKFLEACNQDIKVFGKAKLREGFDGFSRDQDIGAQVQDDFIPILGGPFFKQLYQTDYIKQQSLAYYASNHDPIARALINLIVDFTLGRGFEIQCDNPLALGMWRAYENANRLQEMMHSVAREIQIYGETMIYRLPGNQAAIRFGRNPENIPIGIIPRVRVIDPSNIWEIVTVPEDIKSVLYYVWLAPTQWQTYAGMKGSKAESSKFIFQTIDAKEMLHFKVNVVSNEKRGRSDLFPILGYLKRLRDSVNYSILSQLKQSAWSIDTSIEGSQADIDAYMAELDEMGTIPNAGSEFIHTSKVKREMLSPQAGRGISEAFEWVLSMICAGYGVPMNYLGTHLSGGQTRAGAIVATEPFAKKVEMRQNVYREIIGSLWKHCMEWAGMPNQECKIILPEIVVQDRSMKLRDLTVAVNQKWIARETAAEIAAKELGIDRYDFEKEKEKMESDKEESFLDPAVMSPIGTDQEEDSEPDTFQVDSKDKKEIKDQYE